MIKERPELGHVYVHINNGGVNFGVEDLISSKDGKVWSDLPEIVVDAGSFGMQMGSTRVIVNPDTLKLLSEYFAKAYELYKGAKDTNHFTRDGEMRFYEEQTP